MSGEEFPGFGGGEQPDMVVAEGPAVENAELAPEGVENAAEVLEPEPEGSAVGDTESVPEELGDGVGINGPVAREEEAPTGMEKIKLSDGDRALLLNSETSDIVDHLGELKAVGVSEDEIAAALFKKRELEENLQKLFEARFDMGPIVLDYFDRNWLARNFKKLTKVFGLSEETIIDAISKSGLDEEKISKELSAGGAPLEVIARCIPELFIIEQAKSDNPAGPEVMAFAFNSLLAKNEPYTQDDPRTFEMK